MCILGVYLRGRGNKMHEDLIGSLIIEIEEIEKNLDSPSSQEQIQEEEVDFVQTANEEYTYKYAHLFKEMRELLNSVGRYKYTHLGEWSEEETYAMVYLDTHFTIRELGIRNIDKLKDKLKVIRGVQSLARRYKLFEELISILCLTGRIPVKREKVIEYSYTISMVLLVISAVINFIEGDSIVAVIDIITSSMWAICLHLNTKKYERAVDNVLEKILDNYTDRLEEYKIYRDAEYTLKKEGLEEEKEQSEGAEEKECQEVIKIKVDKDEYKDEIEELNQALERYSRELDSEEKKDRELRGIKDIYLQKIAKVVEEGDDLGYEYKDRIRKVILGVADKVNEKVDELVAARNENTKVTVETLESIFLKEN